ncbi:MAG: pyridoxamine 5'-phosphate oxidase family protein [Oscillospiraceae bacterium]|nr:pyridoxamine 5'-phosphate oxidase family protein [Oscillospiraceae bacterium]
MNKLELFFDAIKKEMAVTLATAAEGHVTMRLVSPVYDDGAILIFTAAETRKYQQLRLNPHCCIAVGNTFMEAAAEFCGACMLPENKGLRDAYCGKFPKAFDEGIRFGGRNAEFILLHPTRLTGWAFENDIPTENGVPTIPFEMLL